MAWYDFVLDLFDEPDEILGVVNTGLDIYGQKRAADREEGAAIANADRLQKEAEYQGYRTETKLKELKQYKDQIVGKQRVAMASSGIRIDDNTALNVVKDTARSYQSDRLAILKEGEFNVERAQLGATAQLEAGSQAKAASKIGIGQSLLTNFFN